MIFNYLNEIVMNNKIEYPEGLFRVLAYVERNAALDTVSFVLNLISIAKEKNLTLDDLEAALSELREGLSVDKNILVRTEPLLDIIEDEFKRIPELKKQQIPSSQGKEPGQASI